MFSAAMDLIVSSLQLARSILGLVDVKNDAKTIAILEKALGDEKTAATKQMCKQERDTMKAAIDSKTNSDNLSLFKYQEDTSSQTQLMAEVTNSCKKNLNLCERMGTEGQNVQNILSTNSNMYYWAYNEGPISDVAVSYDNAYDLDFERLGYVNNAVTGTSTLWSKKIYICRTCSTNIITSVCLADKDKAYDNSDPCRLNKPALALNEKWVVVHISYKQSLIMISLDVGNSSFSGSNVAFVDKINLSLSTVSEDPKFTLSSSNTNKFSYSNGSFTITTPSTFAAAPAQTTVATKDELTYVINDFCVDNCDKNAVNTKNKCLNFFRFRRFYQTSKSERRRRRNQLMDASSDLRAQYNTLCSSCSVTNTPKPDCVTFYENSNYEGKSWNYCENTSYIGDDANDKFSSVKIDSRYYVKAYEHKDYGGIVANLQGNLATLEGYNDYFSSLKVCLKFNDC